MSSDVLVLGAMVVTVVSTAWWALTPVGIGTDAEDHNRVADDIFDAEAA